MIRNLWDRIRGLFAEEPKRAPEDAPPRAYEAAVDSWDEGAAARARTQWQDIKDGTVFTEARTFAAEDDGHGDDAANTSEWTTADRVREHPNAEHSAIS